MATWTFRPVFSPLIVRFDIQEPPVEGLVGFSGHAGVGAVGAGKGVSYPGEGHPFEVFVASDVQVGVRVDVLQAESP